MAISEVAPDSSNLNFDLPCVSNECCFFIILQVIIPNMSNVWIPPSLPIPNLVFQTFKNEKKAFMRQHYLIPIVITLLCACNVNNNSKKNKSTEKGARTIGCYIPQTNDKAWYSSGKKRQSCLDWRGSILKFQRSVKRRRHILPRV